MGSLAAQLHDREEYSTTTTKTHTHQETRGKESTTERGRRKTVILVSRGQGDRSAIL